MWNPPPKAETHGVIREYNIIYRQVKCSSNGTNLTMWSSVTVNGSSVSAELTNLTKWSCYEVQIHAITIKNGVWSDAKKQRTSEDGKTLYFVFETYVAIVYLEGYHGNSKLTGF